MKVKFLLQGQNQRLEDFEEQVNDWIADVKVIDIKYDVDRREAGAFVFTRLSVMILYEATVSGQEEHRS